MFCDLIIFILFVYRLIAMQQQLISKEYIQMAPMPNNKNANINKLFGKIDNINSKEQYDRLHVPINIKDENGDSILHHILIHALDEEQALMKIKSIDKIETLINTTNKKGQTPMHLICKYQYHDTFNYIVDKCENEKETVGTKEFELENGDIDIEGGAKDDEIKINYIAFDNKRKTPFNYLLHGVLHNKSNDKTNMLKEFKTDKIKSFNDFTNLLNNNLQICFDNNDINIRFINNNFIDDYIKKIGKKMHLLMNTYVDNRQLNKFIDENNKFINNNNTKIILIIKHLFNKNINELQDIRYQIHLKKLQQSLPKNNSQNAMQLFSLLPYVSKTYLMFLYINVKFLLTLHKDEIDTLLSLNQLNFENRFFHNKYNLIHIQQQLGINYLKQYLYDIPTKHTDIIGDFDNNIKNTLMKITNMINDEYKELFNYDLINDLKNISITKIPHNYLILLRLPSSQLKEIKDNIKNIETLKEKINNYNGDKTNKIFDESYKNVIIEKLTELSNDTLNQDDIINKIIKYQKNIVNLINNNIPLLYLDNYEQLTYLYDLLTVYMNKNNIDIFNNTNTINCEDSKHYIKGHEVKIYNYHNYYLLSLINEYKPTKVNEYKFEDLYDSFKKKFKYNNFTYESSFITKVKNSSGVEYQIFKDENNNIYLNNDANYYKMNDITVDGSDLIFNKFDLKIILTNKQNDNLINLNSDKILYYNTKTITSYFDTTIDQDIYIDCFRININNNNIHIYINGVDTNNKTYIDFDNKLLVYTDKNNKQYTYSLQINKTIDDHKIQVIDIGEKYTISKKIIIDNNDTKSSIKQLIYEIYKSLNILADYSNFFTEIDNLITDYKNTITSYKQYETNNLFIQKILPLLNVNTSTLTLLVEIIDKKDKKDKKVKQIIFKIIIDATETSIATFDIDDDKNMLKVNKCDNNVLINKQLHSNYVVNIKNINYKNTKGDDVKYIVRTKILEDTGDTNDTINMILYDNNKIYCTNNINCVIMDTTSKDTIDNTISFYNKKETTSLYDCIYNNYSDKDGKMTNVSNITITKDNITFDNIGDESTNNNYTELILLYKDNIVKKVYENNYIQKFTNDIRKIYLYAYLLTLNKLGIHNNYINHEYFNSISTIFDDINDVVTNNLMKTYEDIKLKLLQKFQSEKIVK